MARGLRCPPAIEALVRTGSPVMRRRTAGPPGRLVLTVGCEMAPHGFIRKWAHSGNERDEISQQDELPRVRQSYWCRDGGEDGWLLLAAF